MRTAVAFCLAVLGLLSFAQAQKHPFTFEDMMALKRVEEPEVSPDGKWVLFAAVDVDLKASTKTPHVWVVPLNSNLEKSGMPRPSPVLGSLGLDDEEARVPHPGVPRTPVFGVMGWRASPVLARVGDTNDKTLKAGSSTTQDHSQANDPASVGMTANKEREIISDQDADRPRWAPDGKRFAFVSNKEKGSQIWVADFDGASGTVTAKHRLTNIATEASGELWSPDGKNILFKSDVYPECDATPAKESACNAKKVDEARNSKVKAQIFTHLLYRHWNAFKEGKQTHLFVIPVEGCTTNHVGRGALTRAGELYSPDAAQSAAGRVGAPAPTRDEKGSGPCSVARDLTPGDYDAPVFSLGGQDNYAFSPDRQEICYASNHDREPAISTNNDLFTVPVRVGAGDSPAQVLAATKDITSENKAADNTPLYSPDGKYIAYRAQQRPGYESDRWRLMLYDRKTAKTYDTLRGDLDRWVGSFTWAPDSKAIYLSTEDKGESPIRYFFVGGDLFGEKHDASDAQQTGSQQEKHKFIEQEWARLYSVEVEGGYNDDLTIVGNGTRLLFTRMSISAPNEIQVLSIRRPTIEPKRPFDVGATPIVLTRLNDSVLSQVSMSPLESFWFPGANGDKVQGFLVRPPNFDPNKKYPVKFLIHGGPQGAWGDDWSYRWNPELFAAPTSSGPGYVVIMINFHGSTGYGQKFIDAINGDWGGAAFEDLMKGLDYAEQHYPFIDKDRECALGASYGGYMANWIIGHTNRFKCIVSHDGMFNTESAWGDTEELWFNEWEFKGTPYANREQYRKWSPHLSATNFKTPTLVVHGQLDYRLDVSQGFDLFTTLQRQGVPSKMLYFPDEGHWVLKPQNSQVWYKTVNDWVDQWVGK